MHSPTYSSGDTHSLHTDGEFSPRSMSPFSNFDGSFTKSQLPSSYTAGFPDAPMYEPGHNQDQLAAPSLYSSETGVPPVAQPKLPGLSLGQLLVTQPVVRELYNDLAETKKRLLETQANSLRTQEHMHQEFIDLARMMRPDGGSRPPARPSDLSASTRSGSLAPSDSLSQAPSQSSSSRPSSAFLSPVSHFHQPASRPSEFPFEVLWCLEDCRHDPDAKISVGNASRPSMQTVIRNPDGTMISEGVWNAIKLSSRQIAQSLLSIKLKGNEETRAKTKQFFKSFYSAQWTEAVEQLERLQPLLQLCAGNWKADHVLGSTLSATTQHTASKPSKRHSQGDDTPVIKKKPREDDITTKVIHTMHERNMKAIPEAVPDTTNNVPAVPELELELSAPGTPSPGSMLRPAAFSRGPSTHHSPKPTTSTLLDSTSIARTVPIDFLRPCAVDPSCENLISLLSSMQPPLQGTAGVDLLNAFMANPTFPPLEPSSKFMEFLERIEMADPDAFADDEDNLGSSWGHYQFTAGALTCTTVIDSWAAVGSPVYACRLIAAALTTCQVARWLCRDTRPEPYYLSDDYLVKVTEMLWRCWMSASGPILKGKGKVTDQPSNLEHTPADSTLLKPTQPSERDSAHKLSPSNAQEEEPKRQQCHDTNVSNHQEDSDASNMVSTAGAEIHKTLRDALGVLHVPELKQYAKDNQLTFRGNATKAEMISLLCALPDSQQLSEDVIQTIVAQRLAKKGNRAVS
ncbi:hypothetical protein HWV62_31193 [Athelia sp. TMB]|nr:hypothetical protein HWV62_31193 [Athelia sp. TMB]